MNEVKGLRIPSTGLNFAQQIAVFAKLANMSVDQARRGVLVSLFGAIIEDTPVDTGRLRANWICTLNNPATGTWNRTDAENVLSMTQTVGEMSGDQPVYFVNNLPYAYRIEYEGWSHTKAPDGMVRRNIIRFEALMDEEIKRLSA